MYDFLLIWIWFLSLLSFYKIYKDLIREWIIKFKFQIIIIFEIFLIILLIFLSIFAKELIWYWILGELLWYIFIFLYGIIFLIPGIYLFIYIPLKASRLQWKKILLALIPWYMVYKIALNYGIKKKYSVILGILSIFLYPMILVFVLFKKFKNTN